MGSGFGTKIGVPESRGGGKGGSYGCCLTSVGGKVFSLTTRQVVRF